MLAIVSHVISFVDRSDCSISGLDDHEEGSSLW